MPRTNSPPAASLVRFAPFEADLRTHELRKHGHRLKLPGLPFEVLTALLQQPGELVTREELQQRLWPDGTFVDFDNNLNSAVTRLRQALGDSAEAPRFIETLPRLGYRFIAQLDAGIPESPSPIEPPAKRADAKHPPNAVRWLAVTATTLAVAAVLGFGWQWIQGWRVTRESNAALERGQDLMRESNAGAAVAELQQAIRLDPNNARAYGALAHALSSLGSTDSSSAYRPAGQSPSVAAAERGVELDPACGDCRGTLGMFLFYHDWRWADAEAQYREAIRLSPEEEAIRASHAMLLSAIGQNAEALEEIDFALHRRPYHVTWLGLRSSILYLGRRYLEAIAAADQALLIANKDRRAWEWRSKALFQLGRGAEAVNALAQEPFAGYSADLHRAVREGGTEAGLRKLLEVTGDWRGLIEHSWRRGPWRALLHDTEGALDEVERVYEARRLNALYLGVDPVYDGVRDHPRFQKVLSDMGLKDVLGKHGEWLDERSR